MKLKYRVFQILIYFVLFSIISCNEDEILKEVPLDFAAPENAFVNYGDFNTAVASLYDQTREILSESERVISDFQYGTDLGVGNGPWIGNFFTHYPAILTSSASFVEWHWSKYYKIISSANIIINRLSESELTDEQKTNIEASARFFRGIAYKNLAHLYGGVPIDR